VLVVWIVSSLRAAPRSRQLYLRMCDVLLRDPATTQEWFRRYFFAGFLSMGQDAVSNVRLTFLRTLSDKTVPGVSICVDFVRFVLQRGVIWLSAAYHRLVATAASCD
jgi:hypothetical protein